MSLEKCSDENDEKQAIGYESHTIQDLADQVEVLSFILRAMESH